MYILLVFIDIIRSVETCKIIVTSCNRKIRYLQQKIEVKTSKRSKTK